MNRRNSIRPIFCAVFAPLRDTFQLFPGGHGPFRDRGFDYAYRHDGTVTAFKNIAFFKLVAKWFATAKRKPKNLLDNFIILNPGGMEYL